MSLYINKRLYCVSPGLVCISYKENYRKVCKLLVYLLDHKSNESQPKLTHRALMCLVLHHNSVNMQFSIGPISTRYYISIRSADLKRPHIWLPRNHCKQTLPLSEETSKLKSPDSDQFLDSIKVSKEHNKVSQTYRMGCVKKHDAIDTTARILFYTSV